MLSQIDPSNVLIIDDFIGFAVGQHGTVVMM